MAAETSIGSKHRLAGSATNLKSLQPRGHSARSANLRNSGVAGYLEWNKAPVVLEAEDERQAQALGLIPDEPQENDTPFDFAMAAFKKRLIGDTLTAETEAIKMLAEDLEATDGDAMRMMGGFGYGIGVILAKVAQPDASGQPNLKEDVERMLQIAAHALAFAAIHGPLLEDLDRQGGPVWARLS